MFDSSSQNCLSVECQREVSCKFSRVGRFQFGQTLTFLENQDFSDTMNSFIDSDQIISIETSCAHYTLNLICFGRLFNAGIRANKSPRGETMKIFETSESLRLIKNQNAIFSASNNIDFWYREIHMAETYFSKIEQSTLIKYEKNDL